MSRWFSFTCLTSTALARPSTVSIVTWSEGSPSSADAFANATEASSWGSRPPRLRGTPIVVGQCQAATRCTGCPVVRAYVPAHRTARMPASEPSTPTTTVSWLSSSWLIRTLSFVVVLTSVSRTTGTSDRGRSPVIAGGETDCSHDGQEAHVRESHVRHIDPL